MMLVCVVWIVLSSGGDEYVKSVPLESKILYNNHDVIYFIKTKPNPKYKPVSHIINRNPRHVFADDCYEMPESSRDQL